MRLTEQELASLCREFGPQLHVPEGVDGIRLLWAFAARESSFGRRCIPLHEQAYCYGGKYYGKDQALRDMTESFGCHAHCSYGPWQVLFYNAIRQNRNIEPYRLTVDSGTCASITVAEFNRILDVQKPPGVREIADAWNSGNWRDDIHPIEYMDAVQGFYLTSAMPTT